MVLASWHKVHFRVAILLALLLPWQSYAAVDVPCTTLTAASADAAGNTTAAPSHCREHAPAVKHHQCLHCVACATSPWVAPPHLPALLRTGNAAEPTQRATRDSSQPSLDRLDRPPR